MNSSWCHSCCSSCHLSPPPTLASDSPFSLHHLLALGTLVVHLPVAIEQQICEHIHAEDGWHKFNGQKVISRTSEPVVKDPDDIIYICHAIDYLIQEQFIAATCHSNNLGFMDVRIYLIPYDLANVKGRLRVRKDSVLNTARQYLRNLLPSISQNVPRWQGTREKEGDIPVLPMKQQTSTLADIYSELSSPSVSPVPGCGNITSRLLDFHDDLDGLGMRTPLYRYQRQSVAAMMQKELDLRDVPDPLYIQANTVGGKPFFLQPGTMEVLQERPMSVNCRGGLLCEELGTGKTIMMISLIVATKDQLSSPEPSLTDEHLVMTPVAYRHFSSSTFASARKRAEFSNAGLTKGGSNVPSLVELLLHHGRTNPFCDVPRDSFRCEQQAIKEDKFNNLPLAQAMRANIPFYHQYFGEPTNRQRDRRTHPPRTPRVMYLTSATLVIVPANLISQWDREITKHCAVPLRVLILRATTPTPSVQRLATDYDIILMSYSTFSREAKKHDTLKLHAVQPCECLEFDGIRVPNCTCKVADISPFLQIRWKRLIIDEGHRASHQASDLVAFTKMLSIERRWIVTGTPTTNLLGLSLGSKTVNINDTEDFDIAISGNSTTTPTPRSTPPSSPPTSAALHLHSDIDRGRVWNQDDRGDLTKLGQMIAHFLAVPQFAADPKLVSTHVIEPLLDRRGPRPGAFQVLNQLMELVMIRHRIEDVEQEVLLPPVTQESVLLDMDPYVMKSFNALQAIIIINAVDSQREHQDYLFHARNADLLQLTMTNMSQILFWHVDSELYNAEQLIKEADVIINRAIERQMPQEDISALREAFQHIRYAIEDPLWTSFQSHEDVPYRVFDLNERVFKAWTRTPGKEPGSDDRQTGFVHADRLWKMNKMVVRKPLTKEDRMIAYAFEIVEKDREFRDAFERAERKKTKGQNKNKNSDNFTLSALSSTIQTIDKSSTNGTLTGARKGTEVESSASMATKGKGKTKRRNSDASKPSSLKSTMDRFTAKASSDETLSEMRKELGTAVARLEREEAEEDDSLSTSGPSHPSESPNKLSLLAASSLLAKMRIGSSASSKLNYIINEVQKYSTTEKFLIFSESALSLAHVAEALELMHIKFLRFTTQVKPLIREQLVLTFETSETYRVFLMELRHGARGLNLVSASRIIFCEPVWQADVESQAIKRAHRIGQKKPITVKTLAIRRTAEENMVLHRSAMKNSHEKLPKVLEETGMRQYIANPKFISDSPILTPINEFPLLDLPPELLQPRPRGLMLRIPALRMTSHKRVRVEDPINEVKIEEGICQDESRPTKRRKKAHSAIRFATP